MPTRGSHAHDVQRHRLRHELEGEGLDDRGAAEQADRRLRQRINDPSPSTMTDRAAGPYGERGGGGDPGAIIELRSPAFSDQTMMPVRLTRPADNLSPALEWEQPPQGSAELALWCEDRDVRDGSFVHWLITGIPPAVTSIDEGTNPAGATVWPNSFGERRYDGPEPPIGDDAHRYFFQLFALDAPLDLSEDATMSDVRDAIGDHRVAAGTLIGLFAR